MISNCCLRLLAKQLVIARCSLHIESLFFGVVALATGVTDIAQPSLFVATASGKLSHPEIAASSPLYTSDRVSGTCCGAYTGDATGIFASGEMADGRYESGMRQVITRIVRVVDGGRHLCAILLIIVLVDVFVHNLTCPIVSTDTSVTDAKTAIVRSRWNGILIH